MMDNASQLLMRHLNRLRGLRLLVVNYPDGHLLRALYAQQPHAAVEAFTHDFAAHRRAQAAYQAGGLPGERLGFGAAIQPAGAPFDAVVLFLPKSRPLLAMTLAMTAPLLAQEGAFYLVGENKAGIRSAQALLAETIGPVKVLDTARHCALLHATRRIEAPPLDLERWVDTYTVEAGEHALTVISLPGVFSQGRLDEGTRLLLETLDAPPGPTVLDFGCGAGVIGAAVKRRWPQTTVTMTDANALALEAARRTWAANNLPPDPVVASDVFSHVDGRFAQIVSNPPFHSGVQTDNRVVTTFLQEAKAHLAPGGALRIVANRFLKYAPLMETHVGLCRVMAESPRYYVLESAVAEGSR